jgi:hypothetical protein
MEKATSVQTPQAAFWRTRSMARVTGVNLGQALVGGQLTVEVYATLVARCRKCPGNTACETWLGAMTPPRPAPPFCRNAHVFNELSRIQSREEVSDGTF